MKKLFTALVTPDNQINNHEYVDLGLPSGLKWATCNVGANSPEEYGDYFAWGETEPKEEYSCPYKYGTDDDPLTITKYCSDSDYGKDGFTDNKTVLDPEDDAATANLGGAWRMPTYDEMDELKTKCTWTWTTQNGVEGSTVTGPNGNSIFLPAAGYMYKGELVYAGEEGYYWSSSLRSGFKESSYHVYFYSNSQDYYNSSRRDDGQTIRPVCE